MPTTTVGQFHSAKAVMSAHSAWRVVPEGFGAPTTL